MARLSVDGLFKQYDGRPVVNGVSFTVDKGEVVGLLGPNGAGKTTIFRMVMGLITPDGGSVVVDGRPVDTDPEAVRNLVGYLPEVTSLYREMTVRELGEYFADLHDVPFDETLLDTVGLTERADDRFQILSYGLQRRTGLLIALVHDPPLLVLDEMTKGLDPVSAHAIRNLVRELVKSGKSVLSSTHNLWEAERVSDRVLILQEGLMVREVDLHKEKEGLESIFMKAMGLDPDEIKGADDQ
ncbi:MAG: ABC transporter ATP-binding protein [Candidatus Undinarchaeales archaeon]|jgi:ABC-type multidrug transport system ATPase subunit|nr:ABC transporter ATP-binding protein [Candidatus Undinarchaeales archaeon]